MKQAYNIVHIDTCPASLAEFKSVCSEKGDSIILSSFSDVEQGLSAITYQRPDIVVLEVELGHFNGIDLLRELQSSSTKVVFVTADPSCSRQAFDLRALHYIAKSFTAAALDEIIRRYEHNDTWSEMTMLRKTQLSAVKTTTHVTSRIYVNHAGKIHTIRACDILYMQAEGKNTRIYVKDGRNLLSSLAFKGYLKEFKGHPDLAIIHNTCLVNKSCIREVKHDTAQWYAVMENNQTIELSEVKNYAISPRKISPWQYFNRI